MFHGLPLLIWAGLFAWAPQSSRSLNLAWILLFGFLVVLFLLRFGNRQQRDHRSALAVAAKTVVFFFFTGLSIKLLAQWHWGGPVQKISFELNALAASCVSLAICILPSRQDAAKVIWLGLAGFCTVALFTAMDFSLRGDSALPTNAVNWGAGVALVLCILPGWVALQPPASARSYLSIGLVMLLVLAVFVSARRGAFFSIFWVIGLGALGMIHTHAITIRRRAALLVAAGSAVLVSGTIWMSPSLLEVPIDRLREGVREVSGFAAAAGDESFVPRGAMDTRLYIYSQAMKLIQTDPWEGVGPQAKRELVRTIEERLQAQLFHLHNEYLDAWVAYGVPGLLASLMFPAGLMLAGWRLRKTTAGPAWMLLGVGLSHFTSGISNVNTFHNYYQTMFAVVVVLPFLLAIVSSAPDQNLDRD